MVMSVVGTDGPEGDRPLVWAARGRSVALGVLVVCLAVLGVVVQQQAPVALVAVATGLLAVAVLVRGAGAKPPEPEEPTVEVPEELPGRPEFVAAAEVMLSEGEGNPAVLVVLLDGFRDVQTVLGDTPAEEVLAAVGVRVAEVAQDWPAGSLGGERFAVAMRARPFLPAHHLARRIREHIAEPMVIGGVSLRLRAFVGIAQGEGGAEVLTTRATIAAATAQDTNEGLVVHQREDPAVVRRRLDIVSSLSEALEKPDERGFRPLFQPIVDGDGVLISAEALARWDDPKLGAITPDTFIPLAERTGLVAPLFTVMLAQSLLDCRRWRDGGVEAGLSINVSPVNLRDPLLTSELTARLEDVGLSPSDVTLEITESAVIDDYSWALVTLRELRKLGFGVALDDFGMGYSSLGRLHDLPVSVVKLDRSFVAGLPGDERSVGIVRATVDVCRLLGLVVVAEGVETDQQADMILEMGVDRMQGFLFSPAISVDEIVAGPVVAGWESNR